MKITKATVIKLVVATIVPGGFIIWGLHEINKRYGRYNKAVRPDPSKNEHKEADLDRKDDP